MLGITRTYVGLVENGHKPFSEKLERKLLKVVASGDIHAPGAIVNGGIIGHNGTITPTSHPDPATNQEEIQEIRRVLEAMALDISLIKKLLTK